MLDDPDATLFVVTPTGAPSSSSRALKPANLRPHIDWQDFLQQNREEAQMLRRGTAGEPGPIPGWSDLVAMWNASVQQYR
jgi:hypothetical protein